MPAIYLISLYLWPCMLFTMLVMKLYYKYIFLQPHPSQREEESCHTTTDELSPRNTIIVLPVLLMCLCKWVATRLQKACISHGNFLVWKLLDGCSQTLPHFVKVWLARLQNWVHNECSISTMANKWHPCLTLQNQKSPWLWESVLSLCSWSTIQSHFSHLCSHLQNQTTLRRNFLI